MDYELIHKALEIAIKAHEKQKRKASDTPYIVHPLETAIILLENGMTDQIVVAGLLHDTLEDTMLTKQYIEQKFGKHILSWVVGASEVLENRKNRSWKERKNHTITYLKNAPLEVKCISCADKLSNARSLLRDLEKMGNRLWDKFNAPYEQQRWYYQELVKSLQELYQYKMYVEFKQVVQKLFSNNSI